MTGESEQGGMGGVFEIPLEGWAAGNLSKRRKRKEEGIQEDGFVGSPKWTKDRGTEQRGMGSDWKGSCGQECVQFLEPVLGKQTQEWDIRASEHGSRQSGQSCFQAWHLTT